MKREITYIALDGTRFDDEEACEDYEAKLLTEKYGKNALFFDDDGKPLSFDEDGFLSSAFILCKTKEAAQYLQDEYGPNYYTPWDDNPIDAGCWMRDEGDHNNWRPIEDYIDELKDALNTAYKILKKAEEN